jgi:peptide-methionine (R)-S-oxide reductase
MKKYIVSIILVSLVVSFTACSQPSNKESTQKSTPKVMKTDAEWKKELSAEQYQVLRKKGTERAFTGKYWNNHEKGSYHCAGCGKALFDSKTKYESGSGWPSFWQPIDPKAVKIVTDKSLGMVREEVVCSSCEGHLGHVFNDGPKPTGLRYCMNSISMEFVKTTK